MYQQTRNLTTALLLTAGLLASPLTADTLTLSDGSILNGQIKRIEGGEITLNTAFAGIITVKQDQVTQMTTVEPVYVQTGPSTVFGTVTTSIDGLRIQADDTQMNTPISGVEAVWRTGEKSPKEIAMERNWAYVASLGLSGKSGNTDRFSVLAAFRATLKGPDDNLTFYGTYDNSEDSGETTSNELKGGAAYTRNISKQWGWYVRTELETDESEELDLRSTTGGGANFVWQDTKNWQLSLRGGLAYRYEAYYDGTTNELPGLDFVLTNSWNFGPGVMKNLVTYNPAFEDFGNYRFFQETTFAFPITSDGKWNLLFGFSNDYNSEPAPGLESMDNTYFTQFMLKFD